jgi:crotonobetainyl-CoA:carnitine CoA-transferase CaiB-like acyl-CoA transferase
VSTTSSARDGAATSRVVLDGVRVADFSHALAGPICSMILGDFGADVVKIERPGGDQVRGWGPPFHNGDAAYYYAANRNKRSIVLDLKDPDDLGVARALVDEADVLIENSRPGVMARFGLDFASLNGTRPDLVYCSITSFGRLGPPELAGYDLILQAVSGIMSLTGPSDGEPTKAGIPVVDQVAGLYATVGVLAAIAERGRSGQGQHVEISLVSSALAALANRAASYLLAGTREIRLGNAHPNVAPYEVFEASDRPFVLAAPSDQLWQRACHTLERGDLLDDPSYVTNSLRVLNRSELKYEIERTTRARPAAEWVERFTRASVPAAMVNELPDAFAFAEELGISTIEYADVGGAKPVPLVRNPITLSRTPARRSTAPPRLDEHGSEIRREVASTAGATK